MHDWLSRLDATELDAGVSGADAQEPLVLREGGERCACGSDDLEPMNGRLICMGCLKVGRPTGGVG
jgi:hypothetical protein